MRPLLYLGRAEEALDRWLAASSINQAGLRTDSGQSLCLAHLGRVREAGALLRQQVPKDIPAEEDEAPAGEYSLLLEAAATVGDAEACDVLSERLAPLAHLAFIDFRNQSCMARILGAAAMVLGRPHQARTYYEQALEVRGRIRFRPEIALTRLGLAELMLTQGEKGAADHLDLAIAEFQEMNMQPSLERALKHKGLLHA